jgi:peptidoglycan/LPS O-acetylase OafA/YrhL
MGAGMSGVRAATPQIGALTAIRGLAAWWVVAYHFREYAPSGLPDWAHRLLAQGDNAVDLFFVLSGFVIALNYRSWFGAADLPGTLHFYLLRLARVYPLHLAMLGLFLLNPLAILLFSGHGDPGPRYDPAYFVMSLFLVQNWGFTRELAWNVPAWSISTELFAYLLFPLMLAGAARAARGPRSTILLIGLLLGLLAAVFIAQGLSLGGDIPRFGLLRCVVEFAVGVLLCRLAGQLGDYRRLCIPAALLGLACYATIFLGVPDAAVVPLAFTLLILALSEPRALPARCLDLGWLRAIGVVSYSTYMVHYFVRDWVKFGLVDGIGPDPLACLAYVALTAIGSVVLYRLVEVPGRIAGGRLAGRAVTALRAAMPGRGTKPDAAVLRAGDGPRLRGE